jgi:hypothetical protein
MSPLAKQSRQLPGSIAYLLLRECGFNPFRLQHNTMRTFFPLDDEVKLKINPIIREIKVQSRIPLSYPISLPTCDDGNTQTLHFIFKKYDIISVPYDIVFLSCISFES